jgi:hypothetical protein
MMALTFAVIYTVEDAPDYVAFGPDATPNSEYDAVMAEQAEFFGTGYQFPWYCVLLIAAWFFWLTFGYVRAARLNRRYFEAGQAPVQRLRSWMSSRVLIAVDGSQRPPQGPTGPSQRPTAPPPPKPAPAPASPMGSNLPTLYVPTYSGPAKPVRRIETSLGGTTIHDHRGVDPEDL